MVDSINVNNHLRLPPFRQFRVAPDAEGGRIDFRSGDEEVFFEEYGSFLDVHFGAEEPGQNDDCWIVVIWNIVDIYLP